MTSGVCWVGFMLVVGCAGTSGALGDAGGAGGAPQGSADDGGVDATGGHGGSTGGHGGSTGGHGGSTGGHGGSTGCNQDFMSLPPSGACSFPGECRSIAAVRGCCLSGYCPHEPDYFDCSCDADHAFHCVGRRIDEHVPTICIAPGPGGGEAGAGGEAGEAGAGGAAY